MPAEPTVRAAGYVAAILIAKLDVQPANAGGRRLAGLGLDGSSR